MIESLRVSNFRGFQNLNLEGLTGINILVGDNGSGKTALLESIFLAGGLGPEIYLRTRAWRGIGDKIQIGIDRDQYEALWKEIFYSFDQNSAVDISFTDSNSGERELRIYYDVARTTLMPIDMNVRTSYESGDIHPITFEWRTEKDDPVKIRAEITPQGIIQMSAISKLYPIMFLAANASYPPDETAKRFSFLSKRHRQKTVFDLIKSLYPVVRDLSVEIVAGMPGLYASVEGMEEKLAVGSLSGGLNKYLSILFGIASYPSGVVLVDELENGFFYRKYSEVWKGIKSLAETYETQLFISTHSMECLQAALPIVAENPSLFTLLRTEHKGNSCSVRRFDGKDFRAGLEQRIDFR
jgi:ABC-type cobalamin/Fe3+-siderophores transport system ATPase subunit